MKVLVKSIKTKIKLAQETVLGFCKDPNYPMKPESIFTSSVDYCIADSLIYPSGPLSMKRLTDK